MEYSSSLQWESRLTKARLSSRCLFIENAAPPRPDAKLASLMLAVPGHTGPAGVCSYDLAIYLP